MGHLGLVSVTTLLNSWGQDITITSYSLTHPSLSSGTPH